MPVVRATEQKPVLLFARVGFFADFVISSTPMPSVLGGPTDRYESRCCEVNRYEALGYAFVMMLKFHQFQKRW